MENKKKSIEKDFVRLRESNRSLAEANIPLREALHEAQVEVEKLKGQLADRDKEAEMLAKDFEDMDYKIEEALLILREACCLKKASSLRFQIDQALRRLLGDHYDKWINENFKQWDVGIEPGPVGQEGEEE